MCCNGLTFNNFIITLIITGICTRSKTAGTCNVPSSLVKFIWYKTVLVKEQFYLGDYSVYLFPA